MDAPNTAVEPMIDYSDNLTVKLIPLEYPGQMSKMPLQNSIRFPDHIIEVRYFWHLPGQTLCPQLCKSRLSALKDGSQISEYQPFGFTFWRRMERSFLHIYQMVSEQVMNIEKVARFGSS
jgi:hypothetical protein